MNSKRFLIILSLIKVSCSLDSGTLNMISSLVTHEDRPTSLLTAKLCWTSYELKTLAKTLSKEGIALAQSLQANRSEYHLQHVMILADLNCPGIEAFLIEASDHGYFKSPYRWLLLDSINSDRSLEVLHNLNMLVDSDVVVAWRRSEQHYVLTEVYKVSLLSEVIYSTRLIWRPYIGRYTLINGTTIEVEDNGKTVNAFIPATELEDIVKKAKIMTFDKHGVIEDYRDSRVLSSRRQDLRGHTLTIANVITDNDTKKHLDDRLFLHQDLVTKNTYMVVTICFQMLNATEKLIFTDTWGYKDKSGNWTGLVNHLLRKEADLGTQAVFTVERMNSGVEYIAMVGSTALHFVFREPPLTYVSNIFTLPFTRGVWLAIFICVLGCSVFLYITSKWEATMDMHPLQLDGSWADVLILIIGAVLQQGCTLEPRYTAGRCVFYCLFVSLTILYASYSANIVVLLRAPSSSIRTLPDLLNSPLKFGASDFEYNRYFFKKLNDPIRKAIYDKKIAPKGQKPNYLSMKEGVELIRRGLFAFHMEVNPGYRLIQETYQEDEKCDLVEIDYINEIDPWVPGRKQSPFNELFKINFLKIRETGIQACVQHRLQVPRPKCSGTISTFSSVGVTDMYPAMLATLYGMLLAPAVLLLEIAYKRLVTIRQKWKSMKQPNIKKNTNSFMHE